MREIVYKIAAHGGCLALTAGMGYVLGYGICSIENLMRDTLNSSAVNNFGPPVLNVLENVFRNPDTQGKVWAAASLAAYPIAYVMASDVGSKIRQVPQSMKHLFH